MAKSGDIGDVPSAQDMMVDEAFAGGSLYHLRSVVAAHASKAAATQNEVDRMIVIASELVVNAIEHGGGQGRLRLWRDRSHLCVQVVDRGPGIAEPEKVGRLKPPLGSRGRGLWAVRAMADHVSITSDPAGTSVTAALALSRPPPQRPANNLGPQS